MITPTQARLGIALLAGSAIAFSSAGFYTRLIETDAWTMLFWRGVFGGLFLAGVLTWRERRRVLRAVRDIGRAGILIAFCSAIATVCFINALRLSSVADVLVIDATIPFLTAGIAWLMINEREDRVTLLASLVALIGVAVMAGPAVAGGRMLGDLLAFVMAVLMSTAMVMIRRNRGVSMLPAVGLSAFLCALIVSPVAHPFDLNVRDVALLGLFGASQFGLGLLLLALGTPLVSATRGALIGVLQTPLGMLWVWLAFAEVPTFATLVGGTIVMAAVVGDIVAPRSEERSREQPAAPSPTYRQADGR